MKCPGIALPVAHQGGTKCTSVGIHSMNLQMNLFDVSGAPPLPDIFSCHLHSVHRSKHVMDAKDRITDTTFQHQDATGHEGCQCFWLFQPFHTQTHTHIDRQLGKKLPTAGNADCSTLLWHCISMCDMGTNAPLAVNHTPADTLSRNLCDQPPPWAAQILKSSSVVAPLMATWSFMPPCVHSPLICFQ